MQIYDTLTSSLKEFKGINGKRINMFVCGPTVNDRPHLGHAKTFIFFDVLAKYLRHKGYHVFFLMNITDVEDKIITKMREENLQWEEIVTRYSGEFFLNLKRLRIDSINYFAFATDFIPEIIGQIKRLIENGLAYETDDGVYFKVRKFKGYGKLSHQSVDALVSGARVDINERKEDPLDFVLWKKRKEGEPFWLSPWGEGRPGWHIEDTAITETFFGPHYDLHGGASDLVFPHHESEIAQMEGISGKEPLVNYWVHTGHLNVEDVKMSKSLKNFITIEEVLKHYWPEAVRIFVLSIQYRGTSNYSEKSIKDSQIIAEKISLLHHRVLGMEQIENENSIMETAKILEPLDHDMNTQEAMVRLNDFLKRMLGEKSLQGSKGGEIKFVLDQIDQVFGIVRSTHIPNEALNLIIKERNAARKRGDYATADSIRNELNELGVKIEDSSDISFLWW